MSSPDEESHLHRLQEDDEESCSNNMIMPVVDEGSVMVLNQNSFNGIIEEAKSSSIIFDSFASLDDPNAPFFGLPLEQDAKNAAVSSSVKPLPLPPKASSVKKSKEANLDKDTTLPAGDESNKPKRPLTAYNLFFQLERERLIAGTTHVPFTAEDVKRVADARRIQMMNDSQPKRKHRKSHGSKLLLLVSCVYCMLALN